MSKTEQSWQTDADGNQIFDSPVETGARMDSKQGKVKGFSGTCGLVSCENILKMAGINVSEADVVSYASRTRSQINGAFLCSRGMPFAEDNGATSVSDRNEILSHFGVDAVALPCDIDSIARYVEEGRGVIISVHAEQLYYGSTDGGDLHAICVTSVKRDPAGHLVGFYVCDSNGYPSEFYYAAEIDRALSGRDMNVTSSIIR